MASKHDMHTDMQACVCIVTLFMHYRSASEARKARELQAHLDRMTASIRKKHQPEGQEDDDDLAEVSTGAPQRRLPDYRLVL